MKLTRLVLASIGSVAILTMSTAKAQVLADWTFESDTVAQNNTPIADSGTEGQTGNSTATADAIGMATYATPNVGVNFDDVTTGTTTDTGANGVADLGKVWRVRGQAGTNGAANGWSNTAPIAAQGAQFFASTSGITSGSINISFDWYATTQGEANLQLEYTTNGTNWINLPLTLSGSDTGLQVLTNSSNANIVNGSYVNDVKQTTGGGQDWFTDLTATITNPAALNDPSFGIEMVNAATGTADVSTNNSALNNTSGNWRFDNVSIQATPEPSSWALAVIVVLALLGVRRACRRSV